jgi:hypothetical protein
MTDDYNPLQILKYAQVREGYIEKSRDNAFCSACFQASIGAVSECCTEPVVTKEEALRLLHEAIPQLSAQVRGIA